MQQGSRSQSGGGYVKKFTVLPLHFSCVTSSEGNFPAILPFHSPVTYTIRLGGGHSTHKDFSS